MSTGMRCTGKEFSIVMCIHFSPSREKARKMKHILKELKLETLLANFEGDRIVLATVLLMNDKELERLDVSAMGDHVRLRGLCNEVGSAGPSTYNHEMP